MITVTATREGRIGKRTATGYIIDRVVPFVALPSHAALYRFLKIVNPKAGKWTYAVVLDVGPWNEHDQDYVFAGARPQAERGIGAYTKPTNASGIDLGEHVWSVLEMTDNGPVSWEFLDLT